MTASRLFACRCIAVLLLAGSARFSISAALAAGTNVPVAAAQATQPPVPAAELLDHTYLMEIVRHLYRWYLDETDVDKVADYESFPFWIRMRTEKLDENDRSQMAEILLPDVGVSVKVKKANYAIPELNVSVTSATFKITSVSRFSKPDAQPPGFTTVNLGMNEMQEYLFKTRRQPDYPNKLLLDRMHDVFHKQIESEEITLADIQGDSIVHVSPFSPVANELWVFWESGHMLIHFSSDIDLANPAVWENESLIARIYDLEKQVVVSHHEAPGSNKFITRDQVGRALYNCIVIGKRLDAGPTESTTNSTQRTMGE